MKKQPSLRVNNQNLQFRIFDRCIGIRCEDELFKRLLLVNFAFFQASFDTADLAYTLERYPTGGLSITRDGELLAELDNDEAVEYMVVYLLEKIVTIDLQTLRTDLYFVHSSALERNGKAIMIAAESGTGKSTTTWALLQHGFRYLSDELAPVDPVSLKVYPYPHALCLKAEPPGPYPLPDETTRTEKTLHVPVACLPATAATRPTPLQALLFLQRDPDADIPHYSEVSAAEASARLYANTLNALAHPGSGLDAAIRIAGAVPAFAVHAGELQATCKLIAELEATL